MRIKNEFWIKTSLFSFDLTIAKVFWFWLGEGSSVCHCVWGGNVLRLSVALNTVAIRHAISEALPWQTLLVWLARFCKWTLACESFQCVGLLSSNITKFIRLHLFITQTFVEIFHLCHVHLWLQLFYFTLISTHANNIIILCVYNILVNLCMII